MNRLAILKHFHHIAPLCTRAVSSSSPPSSSLTAAAAAASLHTPQQQHDYSTTTTTRSARITRNALRRKIKPPPRRVSKQQMMQSSQLMDRLIPANTVIPVIAIGEEGEEEVEVVATKSISSSNSEWNDMPLLASLKQALEQQDFHRKIGAPTDVQRQAIRALLKRNDALIAAETGSGKTLAYLLPLMHKLKMADPVDVHRRSKQTDEKDGAAEVADEEEDELKKKKKKSLLNRPRMIVVVPTKELAIQVQHFVKQICHVVKLRSVLLRSDVPLKQIKRTLATPVDIVVTTPQTLIDFQTNPRLVKRASENSSERLLYYSECRYLVLDEADTLLGKGFREDMIDKIVLPIKNRHLKTPAHKTQFVFVLATYHKQVDQFLKKEFPQLERITTKAMHHKITNVKHRFVECGTEDKMKVLVNLLRKETKARKVLVFTNTVMSARAVDYCLNDNGFKVACFHSEIPPKKRSEYFESFRSGDVPILVCTDIASRGLDIPSVDHVVMFDFPLNVIDYIHRAGRTGRMNAKGKVTSIIRKRDRVLADAIDLAITKRMPLNMITADKKLNSDLVPQFVRRNKDKPKPSSRASATASASRVMNNRRLSSTVALRRLKHRKNLRQSQRQRKSQQSAPSFFDVE